MMSVVIIVALIFIVRAVSELCREKPAPGDNWFHVIHSLTPSKKSRGRAQQHKR